MDIVMRRWWGIRHLRRFAAVALGVAAFLLICAIDWLEDEQGRAP